MSASESGARARGFGAFRLETCLLRRMWVKRDISTPTDVQFACVPEILRGENCIVQAPPGSGKTLTFAIPIVQKCIGVEFGIRALILTPTLERAYHIKRQFALLAGRSCKVPIIAAGFNWRIQSSRLSSNPHFVVATPGRLENLIRCHKELRRVFKNLRFLVLDEAEHLLHPNYRRRLRFIKTLMPKDKQTLFFCDTISDHNMMKQMLQEYSENPEEPLVYNHQEEIRAKKQKEQSTVQDENDDDGEGEASRKEIPLLAEENLVQKYIKCPRDFKDGYMMELLRSIRDDNSPPDIQSMIIFATTCRECQVLSLLLTNMGFLNVSLHSGMTQKARIQALSDFKSSQVTTLIATDGASRGLDIKTVDLVVNYSVPMPDDYGHRVERTGRDVQKGLALTFIVPPRDIQFLTNIEKYIREQLTEMKIEERKVLHILTDVQTQKKLADSSVTIEDPFAERAKQERKVEKSDDDNDIGVD